MKREESKKQSEQKYIGDTYGKITVLAFSHRVGTKKYFVCHCGWCGKEFTTRIDRLRSEKPGSCGCKLQEWMHSKNINRKHGLYTDRAYRLWGKVKQRCYNPNCREYNNYGGRGIKMCDEWLNDPSKFVEWCYATGYDKDAPKGQCTLERIDCNGNYEPSNCTWKTNQEQQNNRRDNQKFEYEGEIHTVAEWARKLNIPYPTLRNGLVRCNKTVEYYIKFYKPYNRKPKQ